MAESPVEEAAPAEETVAATSDAQHEGIASRLEQVASSVKEAAESVVDKVTDTLHGHKEDEAQK
jgi:hypothetical protein